MPKYIFQKLAIRTVNNKTIKIPLKDDFIVIEAKERSQALKKLPKPEKNEGYRLAKIIFPMKMKK